MRRQRRLATLPGLTAAVGIIVITTLAATPVAAATTTTVPPSSVSVPAPAHLIDMAQPRSDGTIWVLHGTRAKKTLTQINVISQVAVGSEVVSPYAESVALAAQGITLTVGTTKGAYPAVVWYNAITGDFMQAAKAALPITQVAVDAEGDAITSLRGTPGHQMVAVTGISNSHSFHYPVTDHAVDVAVSASGSTIYVLHADGTITSLAFPVGTPATVADVPASAQAMTLSPNGQTLYVLEKPSQAGAATSVAIVSLRTDSVVGSVPVTGHCVSLAVSLDGKTLLEGITGQSSSSIKLVVIPRT
ncbi:MAG TPA: hypothetical protein VHV57_06070 [Acidimicrobiales bacterium]|jgi:hypothetical protein|nr:hypothetical protein [Acidimicrobiales bacterium]